MLTQQFQICGGSIVGSSHIGLPGVLLGRNNQDAFGWTATDNAIIAVICDGCSTEPHSEFGARFGVDLLLSAAESQLARFSPLDTEEKRTIFWDEIRLDALSHMRVLSKTMAGSRSYTNYVKTHMLFTSIVLHIGKEQTHIAAIGDGVAAVNGKLWHMSPCPGNKPPYLAYGIIDTELSGSPDLLTFKEICVLPTSELEHVLIGSDGVEEIIEKAENFLPGRQEKLGALSQFWTEDLYFSNGDAVRRHLSAANSLKMKINREKLEVVTHHPLLKDDTTLIAVRRIS